MLWSRFLGVGVVVTDVVSSCGGSLARVVLGIVVGNMLSIAELCCGWSWWVVKVGD